MVFMQLIVSDSIMLYNTVWLSNEYGRQNKNNFNLTGANELIMGPIHT